MFAALHPGCLWSASYLKTDCPYLAPTPHRGRRNEPAYLLEICRAFAELRGLSFEEVAQITTQNCLRLFRRTS